MQRQYQMPDSEGHEGCNCNTKCQIENAKFNGCNNQSSIIHCQFRGTDSH
jgi:hypothetical protein